MILNYDEVYKNDYGIYKAMENNEIYKVSRGIYSSKKILISCCLFKKIS